MKNHNNNSHKKSIIPEYGAHVPEDKDQYVISTPYGPGLVIRTRRHKQLHNNGNHKHNNNNITMREIELMEWGNTSSSDNNNNTNTSGRPIRPTMLYSPIDYPSMIPTIGSDVMCKYGRGRVMEVRYASLSSLHTNDSNNDHTTTDNNSNTRNTTHPRSVVVVRLSSWRLANRCTVTCYLHIQDVQMVRLKKIYEMSVIEKIEFANECKYEASTYFTKKQYILALQSYAHAIDAVKYVQHDIYSTNIIRADLLLIMITCCNNAATCCTQLHQWDDAMKHAYDALSLLDALESKSTSNVRIELQKLGYTNIRLFGEWKVKSLFIISRVLYEKDKMDDAMDINKKARDIITKYISSDTNNENAMSETTMNHTMEVVHTQSIKQLHTNHKELLKLYTKCKERRKVQLQKERMRAQAMFAVPKTSTSSESLSESLESTNVLSTVNNTNVKANVTVSVDTVGTEKSWNVHESSDTNEEKKCDHTMFEHSTSTIGSNTSNDHSNDHKEKHESIIMNDNTIPWHKDPYLLGGIGMILGTLGTVLLLSQVPKRAS